MPSFNNYKHVFTPLDLGRTTLKNRVEFAPMVCDFTDASGEATQRYIDFVIPEDDFASGAMDITRAMLLSLMEEHKVKKIGDHIIRSIDQDGVHIEGRDWKYQTIAADYIVDALGMKNDKIITDAYADLIPDVTIVGDAYNIANIKQANLSAYNAAANI